METATALPIGAIVGICVFGVMVLIAIIAAVVVAAAVSSSEYKGDLDEN